MCHLRIDLLWFRISVHRRPSAVPKNAALLPLT